MQAAIKFILTSGLLIFAINCHAEIFKCKTKTGAIKFQDSPCDDSQKEEIVLLKEQAGQTVSEVEFSDTALIGSWCEFATSTKLNGPKDVSQPATWNFKDKKSMSYTYKSNKKPKKEFLNPYQVEGNSIIVSNKLIGTWQVINFKGYSMIIEGPYGGYAHLRKGGC